MNSIATDYLVIGAGTAGLSFADTLILQDPQAHVTIVDRLGKPGGHWNDAYPFVTLHQPSAFYGVNSLPLGSGRIDSGGPNAGMAELASGAEVTAYFDRVMQQLLLPSGRVTYLPMSEVGSDGSVHNLLSGQVTQVQVRRKVVDAWSMGPAIAATHRPSFKVKDGARLVPPNALTSLWQTAASGPLPRHYAVIGAGKTAMDTCLWLLAAGATADAITWVKPRDAWIVNRITTQNTSEFFFDAIGSQAEQMAAFGAATSVEDLFLRLEACGAVMRIDADRMPTMFHLATCSQAEVALLRSIGNVVRQGHVRAIAPGRLQMAQGDVELPADTLFIDCTASAVFPRPSQPIYQEGKIVLQMVRLPQPAFSAAVVAYVEAHDDAYPDTASKNAACTTIPFPCRMADYPRAVAVGMQNQQRWAQDKALRQWMRESRLDGFGRLMASVEPTDSAKMAVLAHFKAGAMAAMANLPRLMAQAG